MLYKPSEKELLESGKYYNLSVENYNMHITSTIIDEHIIARSCDKKSSYTHDYFSSVSNNSCKIFRYGANQKNKEEHPYIFVPMFPNGAVITNTRWYNILDRYISPILFKDLNKIIADYIQILEWETYFELFKTTCLNDFLNHLGSCQVFE